MDIQISDLFRIIGEKETKLILLTDSLQLIREQLEKLQKENEDLKKKCPSTGASTSKKASSQ